jgi:hypothetical protein
VIDPALAWWIVTVALVAQAGRIVWLGWRIRFRSPLDITNDDLARQRARRRR